MAGGQELMTAWWSGSLLGCEAGCEGRTPMRHPGRGTAPHPTHHAPGLSGAAQEGSGNCGRHRTCLPPCRLERDVRVLAVRHELHVPGVELAVGALPRDLSIRHLLHDVGNPRCLVHGGVLPGYPLDVALDQSRGEEDTILGR